MSDVDPSSQSGIGLPRDAVRIADLPQLHVDFGSGADRAEAVARAEAVLRREGVVVLDNLVDPALLEGCRREIDARYPDHYRPDRNRFLGSYPGRHTAPLVIDGPFADREIFANPTLLRLGAQLLGPEAILEAFGLLVSLPGSPDQQRHFDGLLFEENKLDAVLPPVAISIAIPLVPLDEISGTTAFWTGTHRQPLRETPPDFAPPVPVGSAIVWDFRLHHSGRGNHGDAARPVLFAVHSRNWWQEPFRARSPHYRKLQVARAIHAGFGVTMRNFTVRAKVVDALSSDFGS